jgi:hypothetical protein
MKAIFSITFFVIFGLIGMRAAGSLSTALVGTRTFESPDEVAQFTLLTSIGIAAAFAVAGIVLGLMLAARYRDKLIRKHM